MQKYVRFVDELKHELSEVVSHCHFTGKCRGMAHSICNLKCNGSNEIPVDFHSGSNYDYHFIIKKLANEFEEQFECLGENTEKCKHFSVPIEKEVMKLIKMVMEKLLLFLT